MKTKIPANPAITNQIKGFHLNILAPSKILNGIKLKSAKNALILKPRTHVINNIYAHSGAAIIEVVNNGNVDNIQIATAKNINDSNMLVKGPAMDIIPFSLSDIYWP